MSDSWDEYAQDWDSNPDAIAYSQLAFNSLSTHFNPAGLNVLDFGCGTGLLSEKIAGVANSVVAVDSSAKMIDILKAKKLANVTALACEISAESINGNSILKSGFDLIVASSVCAFIPNFEKTLADLKALLNPGGVFIQWDWKRNDDEPDFGFNDKSITKAYSKAGLSLVLVTTEFSLTSEKGTREVIMGIAKKE
ncbi:MAG: class I SAM-dependent methyltransferase [Bermanella sp.]